MSERKARTARRQTGAKRAAASRARSEPAPEAAAAPPPAAPDDVTLVPFKIVGTLIGARKDADGNIIGEFEVGQAVIYASKFDQVREVCDTMWWPQFLASQNGGPPDGP